MKKITFILFALIAGTTFAQTDGTADVNATIVSPIAISSSKDLNFGAIASRATDGDVTITSTGGRTIDADMNVPTSLSNSPQAATFAVTASSGYTYDILIPDTVLAATGGSGGVDMDIVFTNDIGASSTGTGNPQPLNVGGTLTVNGGQLSDSYKGTVTVTVTYN
jgi:spore coat protein U-like protein